MSATARPVMTAPSASLIHSITLSGSPTSWRYRARASSGSAGIISRRLNPSALNTRAMNSPVGSPNLELCRSAILSRRTTKTKPTASNAMPTRLEMRGIWGCRETARSAASRITQERDAREAQRTSREDRGPYGRRRSVRFCGRNRHGLVALFSAGKEDRRGPRNAARRPPRDSRDPARAGLRFSAATGGCERRAARHRAREVSCVPSGNSFSSAAGRRFSRPR